MKSSVWKTNPVWRGSEQWLCVCVWFLDGEWSSWNFLGCWKYSISWSGWWLQGAYNYKKIYFTVCIKITTVYVFHLTEQSENCSVVSSSLRHHGLYSILYIPYTVHGVLQARILEWLAFPFPRGSSQLRGRTQVSCVAGGLFTSWATRGAHGGSTYWEFHLRKGPTPPSTQICTESDQTCSQSL